MFTLPFVGWNIGPHYISFVFRKNAKRDSNVTNKPSIHSTTQPVLCWKPPAINHSLSFFLCGLSNELVLSVLVLFMCVLLSFLECMCLSASISPHQFVFRFGYMCICVVFVMRVCTYLHLGIACRSLGCILILLLVRTNWGCDAVKRGHNFQRCNQE